MKICIYIVLIALVVIFFNKTREAFSGSFNKCRAKGFSKEFCIQTPTTHFGPATCQCPNGMLGMRYPGFGGKCVCSPYLF